MGAIACQITSLTIVCSIFYSDADQRKHQSSASLAFVRGIHRGHKWPVPRKTFPFDDVIMKVVSHQSHGASNRRPHDCLLNGLCSVAPLRRESTDDCLITGTKTVMRKHFHVIASSSFSRSYEISVLEVPWYSWDLNMREDRELIHFRPVFPFKNVKMLSMTLNSIVWNYVRRTCQTLLLLSCVGRTV